MALVENNVFSRKDFSELLNKTFYFQVRIFQRPVPQISPDYETNHESHVLTSK